MHHIPYHFIAASGPCVVVDSLVAIDIHEVEARIRSQVTVHLSSINHDGFVLGKTTSSTLDNGKRIWKDIVERLVIDIQHLFFKAVDLVIDFLALINIKRFDARFKFDNLGFIRSHRVLEALH